MKEEAEYPVGARASCLDGYCGEVSRLIVDPVSRKVTHLVIEPRHESGRLVPVGLADAAVGEITLRCSLAEFRQLDPAEEIQVIEDAGYAGGYGPAGSVEGYGDTGSLGVGGSVSGLGIGASLGHHPRVMVQDVIPLGETEVCRGEPVHALDGEIGRVHGFLADEGHRITHVLLAEGHLWGHKEVAIPVSAVTTVENGIWLSLTRQQVRDLPPAR